MKRTKPQKTQPQKQNSGCLPFLLLIVIVIALLFAGLPPLRKNLDYFLRGEADVRKFVSDVSISYQKYLTYPDFIYPLEGAITSPFGERINPLTNQQEIHTGIDIDTSVGTQIKASAKGTVFKTGTDERFGNYILIAHNEIFTTCYAHLAEISVSEGMPIQQGDIIGIAGDTGNTTGPHLHFEIRKQEQRMNPIPFLPKKNSQ